MSEVAQLEEWVPYQGQSYRDLAGTAAVSPGGELVKGDLLVGVPFVTTRATFRVGDYHNAVFNTSGMYVSVEILTGDLDAFKRALARGRITEDNPFDEEEELVFNEGGTGIYRRIVSLWEGLGWIQLPEGPEEGKFGESRLDTPLADWHVSETSPVAILHDNEGSPVFSAPTRILAKRGLRISKYENEYTREGHTRYFA
jgi:hypothetical protein